MNQDHKLQFSSRCNNSLQKFDIFIYEVEISNFFKTWLCIHFHFITLNFFPDGTLWVVPVIHEFIYALVE